MRRFVLAVAVVCGISSAVAAPAVAGTPSRAEAAAGWLARQMVDGERFEADFGGQKFPDQGLTIDAVFAFAAARVSDANADKAIAWLARPEITSGYVGSGTEAYAGAHAKLMLAAQVRRKNPASFGGVDLPAGLRGLLTPSGRFSDRSEFGDFSNAFSQSLALIALDRAGGAPASAVTFLAGTQCADGGFPLNFGQATCAGDVDATAMAVQALFATGRTTDAREGLAWLVTQQQADGGFRAVATGPTNANSTGLAAETLTRHRPAAAAKARTFLRSLQSGCTTPPAQRGAIAYDASGFNAATAPRATAQAILGLTGVALADLSGGGRPQAPVLAC